jgi:hypothetical protein
MMRKVKLVTAALVAMAAFAAVIAASASAELGFFPHTITFTGTSGASILGTAGGLTMQCSNDKLSGGAFENDKEGTIKDIDFEGCKLLGLFAVNTPGDASGVILIHEATFTVGFINKAKLDMGISVHLPAGGITLEVPAAKSTTVVTGSVIGLVSPDGSKVKTETLTFEAHSGTQEFNKLEGGVEEHLTATLSGGAPENAGEKTTETLTTSATAELMES